MYCNIILYINHQYLSDLQTNKNSNFNKNNKLLLLSS